MEIKDNDWEYYYDKCAQLEREKLNSLNAMEIAFGNILIKEDNHSQW